MSTIERTQSFEGDRHAAVEVVHRRRLLTAFCACILLAVASGCESRQGHDDVRRMVDLRVCHQSLFTLGPIMASTPSSKPCDGLVPTSATPAGTPATRLAAAR